jgi:hypothetical protein
VISGFVVAIVVDDSVVFAVGCPVGSMGLVMFSWAVVVSNGGGVSNCAGVDLGGERVGHIQVR